MIPRAAKRKILDDLDHEAVVVILGPRQVGKTTMAREIASERKSIYLDLQRPEDAAKLASPNEYFEAFDGTLMVLDEIHRAPYLFNVLRGEVDRRRRAGHRFGQFLILGSASFELLRQSGESLAGRVSYFELFPFLVSEIPQTPDRWRELWVRGGFPGSYLAPNDARSLRWRRNFIQTYLERDIPDFAPRAPSQTVGRMWSMLAHNHGGLLNASALANALQVGTKSANYYIDLLCELLLVRRLPPFFTNVSKRIVKSPKLYVRDSGILHALLNVPGFEELSGHPSVGASFEGFAIENICAHAGPDARPYFYRTQNGAEIDLVLEFPGMRLWAVEIKRGGHGTPSRGFYEAIKDLKPERAFVVYGENLKYPVKDGVTAVGLAEICALVSQAS